MRLVRYQGARGAVLGAVRGERVHELRALVPDCPATMQGVIAAGPELLGRLRAALAEAPARDGVALSEISYLVPVENPGKVVCLGLNYADHAKEGGHELPGYPSLFLRTATSLIAHGAPMVRPRCSERLDYEAELMIVVGRRARHLTEANALGAVFGYTLFNDGSVRDYQRKTTQWTAGKNFDGTGPTGPWVVTADELPPGAKGLAIRSLLGDRVLQQSNTEHMIFDVARTLVILSEIMTLEPGDLIATGTPEGVGHARTPPLWLKPGDTIAIEVEGIGRLSNPVVDEDGA